jgi:hypothetical protein
MYDEVFTEVSIMSQTDRAVSRAVSSVRSFARGGTRRVLAAALIASGVALAGGSAAAQSNSNGSSTLSASGFELRPFAGAYLPTGNQRDFLKDGFLVGAQASWRFAPALALTGTFGWSRSTDRITPGEQTLDLLQYDVGAEARAASWLRSGVLDFSPFIGLGVGGRTYSYRDLDVSSKTNVDGYGALGGDFGVGRVGLRLEARDYLSRFEPLVGGGDKQTRNDIALAAGLNFRF